MNLLPAGGVYWNPAINGSKAVQHGFAFWVYILKPCLNSAYTMVRRGLFLYYCDRNSVYEHPMTPCYKRSFSDIIKRYTQYTCHLLWTVQLQNPLCLFLI